MMTQEINVTCIIYINCIVGLGPPESLLLEQTSTSMLVTWSPPPPEGEAAAVIKYTLTYSPSDGIPIDVDETNYKLDDLLSNTHYTVQVSAVGHNNLEGPIAENEENTRKLNRLL